MSKITELQQKRLDFMHEFITEATGKYISRLNNTVYDQFGGINYYLLTCYKLGMTPKMLDGSGLSYTARNKFFTFDYCEGSLYLVIKNKNKKGA